MMTVPVPVILAAFDLLRHGIDVVAAMQDEPATDEQIEAIKERIVQSNVARWKSGASSWDKAKDTLPAMPRP